MATEPSLLAYGYGELVGSFLNRSFAVPLHTHVIKSNSVHEPAVMPQLRIPLWLKTELDLSHAR